MQSKIGKEAAPLNTRLTLVLLAEDQPDFLRRALKYYSGFPFAVIVLDTSRQPAKEYDPSQGVEYAHLGALAGTSLSSKVAEGVKRVKTPFMVFATVDSFLIADSLEASLGFLETNDGYGACQGYSLGYRAHVNHVDYFRRDRKVDEDYSSALDEERVHDFLAQNLSLLNAVTRTDLALKWFTAVPADTKLHWQEVGYMSYLAAAASVRILPMPYALHFAQDRQQQLSFSSALEGALNHLDPKASAERQAFAEFLLTTLDGISSLTREQILAGFKAMADSLARQSFQAGEKIVSSKWSVAAEAPEPRFEPQQFIEMPFYNQPFFDELARIEFLIHAIPAGTVQLKELEGVLLKQAELTRVQTNPDAEPLLSRLWQAYGIYAFNYGLLQRLLQALIKAAGEEEEIEVLTAWSERLQALSAHDNGELLHDMESGRLLRWLDSRNPKDAELKKISARLAKNPQGAQICVLLLDLDADVFKLQATFDSLINGHYRSFKVVVFTTGELPAVTTIQNTLHFVRVTESNYIDKINLIARQASGDWLMLAQAGEQFTSAGLLQASIELIDAEQCRAVAVDEVHRQEDGTLAHALRPGFNLDLLQSLPALMARHWLVRRELVAQIGYSRESGKALEFDLLLRLIEEGGMSGLAHLSEPVLICDAPQLETNEDEHKALVRHLGKRGYQAEVSSVLPGTYKIDYRHKQRPMVSILLESRDNLPELQRCLLSILQRTRYPRYEVLICDNNSSSAQLSAWLDQQEQTSSRVRVFRSDERVSSAVLHNLVSQQATGEYLILLDAESQIVNVGWIESLLNQAQRPEVGVVGCRLIDPKGTITQAGLILGLNGGVGSAFVGEPKSARGYMQRLVVEQNYSAVSSACLMIGKELYEALGGLDEGVFAEELNDVDLCLKAGQAGYLTVWTPHVQVIHHGVVRAGSEALSALKGKWSAQFAQDEAYNSNLDLNGTGFTLGAF
ncbi:TIGR00180 family glycosyltransferase [Pseudomonas caspiana]|uniref:Glycosyl transferase family 2 n=1 Tax=Pseudomonas caspiana TaxID=1451454 RepID=A0A1Y3P480_9PSED|nr:TIGR00180 family glycosyltransferase [Pseudomonas caspiana]OUM71594.1 glycosyl transferase family 2 [Pseudomonas caspiana]